MLENARIMELNIDLFIRTYLNASTGGEKHATGFQFPRKRPESSKALKIKVDLGHK